MKRKLFTALLVVTMLFTPVLSHADSGSGEITVPNNCIMKSAGFITRTGAYSYVSVSARSVYPTSGTTDNFTKCCTRLYHSTNYSTPISAKVTLTELQGYYSVSIYEGYLDQTTVNLCFSGNDPNYSAVVAYSYRGN